MQTLFSKYLRLIITPFLLYFSFFLLSSHADAAEKILILPFDLHAETDLNYIKQGIKDMLTSRLAREDKGEIIPENLVEKEMEHAIPPVTAKSAGEIGRKLKADYVVFGSVTFFGESISTDARLLETATGRTAVQFNRTGRSRSELIHHIDGFAAQIKQDVFGQPAPSVSGEAPVQGGVLPPDQEKPAAQENVSSAAAAPAAPAKRMISRKMGMEIRALAVGDVTGDNRQEIVLIDQTDIVIYRVTEKGLQRITELKGKNYNNFLSLEVADINGNGRAEIFVTNLPHSGELMQSFVMEFDGKEYRRIADKQQIFFRTLPVPDMSGKQLIGQKYEHIINTMGINQLYRGEVFKLVWETDSYVPAGNLSLPRGANVLNFAEGDVLHTGKEETLLYNTSNVLKVFDAAGDESWEAEESYGSRAVYLELPDSQKGKKIMHRHYLPTRILPVDFNRDGRLDVLVIKNKESLRSISRLKLFKNGAIVCLGWDGLNFKPLWQSDTAAKHISDVAVADFFGQGRREIVYAVVAKEKSSFKNGQSYVVRQPISASMLQ